MTRGAGRLFGRQSKSDSLGDYPSSEDRFSEDQDALQRLRAGDIGAYGELFSRYRRIAVGYARRYTNSSPDAEDLAQDAFARVLQALRGGKGPTVSMRHYLLTAIRTIATDGFRRKIPKEYATEPDALAALYEREHFDDEQELADWVVEGFNALTDRQQQLVWNHAIEGRSLTSIAPELQISVASASRDYGKAMKTLRSSFADSAAHSSGNPDCERFSGMLCERESQRTPEARAHFAECATCTAVITRLHSRDQLLMSLVLIAGLGGLGLQALRPMSSAVAASAWLSGFSSATKAMTAGAIALCSIAVVVATVLLAQRGAAPPVTEEAPLGSAAADGRAIVTTASCDLRREVAGERREVWQLIGDDSCSVSIERVAAGADSPVSLGADERGGALGVEIARTGEYLIKLQGPDGASQVSVYIPDPER